MTELLPAKTAALPTLFLPATPTLYLLQIIKTHTLGLSIYILLYERERERDGKKDWMLVNTML